MKEYLENEFNGSLVYSFAFEGKTCWVASKIADTFGYRDTSKTIYQCINTALFEKQKEFDVLIDERLKAFKKIALEIMPSLKYVARLVIFYESGLYGFLQFSQKPEAIEFQKLIMQEVMNDFKKKFELEENEEFVTDKEKEKVIEYIEIEVDQSKCRRNLAIDIGRVNTEKMSLEDRGERFTSVVKSLDAFKEVIESIGISSEDKLLFYISLFREAGIELDLNFINNI
jgi:prophage antirepressor-like protein